MNKDAFQTRLATAPSSLPILLALVLAPLVPGCDASGGDPDGDSDGSAARGGSTQQGGSAQGGSAQGGTTASGGSTPSGSGGTSGASNLGTGTPQGEGMSSDRYAKAPVARDNTSYTFIANGWGPGFQSHTVSWSGTAFTVLSMQGTQGSGYEPASYPTVFCGAYSDSKSGMCGLPKLTSELRSLRTGWRWKPNGNTGQYNAAYDVWLSTSLEVKDHSSYLMVWLRDPVGQQPAGSVKERAIAVANVPGTWNLWVGTVLGRPYVTYTRAEGADSLELEFDMLDFVRDVPKRAVSLPGTHILSVAVGFEIWAGPVTNLVSEDFYVDAR